MPPMPPMAGHGHATWHPTKFKTCPACKKAGRLPELVTGNTWEQALINIRIAAQCPECHGTGLVDR